MHPFEQNITNKKILQKQSLLETFADGFNLLPLWRLTTWIQISASLNHHKVMKAEPSWLIPWKLSANLELLIFVINTKHLGFCWCYAKTVIVFLHMQFSLLFLSFSLDWYLTNLLNVMAVA